MTEMLCLLGFLFFASAIAAGIQQGRDNRRHLQRELRRDQVLRDLAIELKALRTKGE